MTNWGRNKKNVIQHWRLFLTLLIIFFLPKSSHANDEWRNWNDLKIKKKLTDHWSIFINPSIRLKDDLGELFYWETRQGLNYKFNDLLDIGGHYLYANQKISGDSWVKEHRAEFQPTFSWNVGGVKIANRYRLEYRVVDGTENWRYRMRLKADRPFELFDRDVKGYVYNEFFYSERFDKYNQNRAAIGMSTKITDSLTGAVYYMYKTHRSKNDWFGVNIIGTSLVLSL